jgi:hypothetical protein
MANIFLMNKEIARGMVCFFHQKKHSYLIIFHIEKNITNSYKKGLLWSLTNNYLCLESLHRNCLKTLQTRVA